MTVEKQLTKKYLKSLSEDEFTDLMRKLEKKWWDEIEKTGEYKLVNKERERRIELLRKEKRDIRNNRDWCMQSPSMRRGGAR